MGIIGILGIGLLLLVLPFSCAKYNVLYNKTVRTEVGKSIMNSDREIFKSSKPYEKTQFKHYITIKCNMT